MALGFPNLQLNLARLLRWVCCTADGTGCVATYPIDPVDGAAKEPAACVVHTKPHAHGVAVGPCNVDVFIPHAGGDWGPPQQTEPAGDAVYQYAFDSTTGLLSPNKVLPVLRVTDGDRSAARPLLEEVGPRHLLFRPDYKFAYSSNEQDNSVTAYSYDADAHTLQPLQTVSSVPSEHAPDGPVGAAARLVMHPSGQYVLAANRGHNSLAVFAIDLASGRVAFNGCTLVAATPRAFHFDPSGRWLYTAGEEADTLSLFAFDEGKLAHVDTYRTGREQKNEWATLYSEPQTHCDDCAV